MKQVAVFSLSLLVLLTLAPVPGHAAAPKLAGLWDASVTVHGKDNAELVVPFRFEISGDGDHIQGSFFNGDQRVTSTGGRFEGGSLLLNFDHYATRLEATYENGELHGKYGNPARTLSEFSAHPHAAGATAAAAAPNIDGQWEIEVESPKGEHAWRLIVNQKGADVSAAILRIDGDTGTLTGEYRDGKFLLSHFSGARPSVLEAEPQADGSLRLTLKSAGPAKVLSAWRPADARAKGLPEPSDPEHFTRVKNPDEAFAFSFPDLTGKLVSNTDPKFKDKVVLVNITGSWCPNCHDEAPFLEALYREYKSRGFEIVALDFEEPEQRKDPTRLQAFLKKYGIEYTYLLAGEPSELQAKIPQAENLNSWPTTFFLGRDGRVRAVHAGFAAAASGPYHDELKREVSETIEQLLAENVKVVASR
jgi:thiol-disulfide isomerase/thioredoxin